MILSFSTQINGKPTYFVEKIWQGFPNQEDYLDEWFAFGKIYEGYNFHPDAYGMFSKLHTIREDKNDRWKVGMMIDFFINARQKNMFCFAPRIPVISIQDFEISYFTDAPYCYNLPIITVDGKSVSKEKLSILSRNDGFEGLSDFFKYFDKDFKGKIIHWTDFKY